MSAKSRVFTIVCECCGAKIEVDADTRSVFSVSKKGHTPRSFEQVVKDVTGVADRAEKKFQKHMEKQRTREEDLEKLFEEAQKKAAKDPNKKPPSIFDYD